MKRLIPASSAFGFAVFATLTLVATAASAQTWWQRPWDHKVAPRTGEGQWYLLSVNDMGGTPAQNNQRDISKSLGRVRKFRVQTTYRLNEIRDLAEILSMAGGPVAETIAKASPLMDQAEALLKEAITHQEAGRTGDARQKIDQALAKIVEAETLAEIRIATAEDKLYAMHLRNAISYADMPELAGAIDAMERGIPAAAEARVKDLKGSCDDLRKRIDSLRARLADIKGDAGVRAEVKDMLDFCDYLLKCVAKDGPREETYDGEPYLRDSEVSDLDLNSVSTIARRVQQLRSRLRRASAMMSALAGEPVSNEIGDRIAASTRWPIDELNLFTRSKFGLVRSLRLMDNNPWDWEFNYTPVVADAISLAGRWDFQIDPKVQGIAQGWFRADYKPAGWKNLYAPNAWERQGVNDWNSIDDFQAAYKLVRGREMPMREGRGFEHIPEHRHYNGLAWYRKTVYVPAEWAGSDLTIRCAGMGGQFRAWVNGQPASRQWRSGWIRIPASAVKFGGPNVLAISCFNDNRNGGFTQGNLWLVREGGTADWRHTAVGGGFVNEESFASPAGIVRYNTIIGSASPACLMATDAKEVNLWGWSMKGYTAPTEAMFQAADGVKTVKLDAGKTIANGADMTANWLLLNVPKINGGYGNPVLVVFQHRPTKVEWRQQALREGVKASFDKPAGIVGLVHPGSAGDPAETLTKRAGYWSRAILAYPEHASEFWTVDPAKKHLPFEVMGTFDLVYNFHRIADDWNTQPVQIAALPILASYALDYKYPGVAEGDWENTGVPVHYQAYARTQFRAKAGTDRLHYETPTGDHATMWKGVGTLFQEVWGPAAEVTGKWGSNSDRAGFAFHKDWHTHLVEGFGLRVQPRDYEEWKELDLTVELHRKAGLYLCLLDFSNDQDRDPSSQYFPHTGGYLRDKPKALDGLAEFWKAVATRYKDLTAEEFGYNFNNEPCTIDVEMYNKLIRRLTDAVREVEDQKWITIDFGDGWASADFVFATEPTGDPRTTYNYHLYYKHDNIIEGRSPELFFPQYNPGSPFNWNNTPDLFIRRIEDTFVYQAVHHVPVWCGEFGGSINNPNQEMLIWADDYIGQMERMGHGWSWWNYNGQAYGRTGLQDGKQVSPVVLVLKRYMHRKGNF